MDLLHPESATAMTAHRREAVRMAQSQDAAVIEKCRRSGAAPSGYTFDELIGKGSFGRVYKGHRTDTKKVVAIKVIDIDDTDFRAVGDQKNEQIDDFNKEIRILRQAQESGAPNLNQMIEALAVHSQLWLICDYCPGGSVKTLMRATNDKLGERYIIVTARELSKALKGLHDAGIMHRDIKAANVLIHEDGRLQLCDFGVATVLDKKTDKRRTFIGTLHWMPPELWDRDPEYSDEVDVWAFGCTIYECAVGTPPNADVREPHQLRSRMRRMHQAIELPAKGDHSPVLRSLVSYTLTPDAAARPSFSDVLEHEYLADTEQSHPTTILSELVKTYYGWLYGGGHRASLFMAGGAAAGGTPGSLTTPDEEWNFSATDTFENRMSTVLNIPDFSVLSDFHSLGVGDQTPKAATAATTAAPGLFTVEDHANFEERVRRGADLSNIFDQNMPEYEYVTKQDFVPIQQRRVSDLPLRAMSEERPYSIANQVIDLGDFDSSNYYPANQAKDEKIKLADAATIKANRGNSRLFPESALSGTLTTRPSTAPRPATREFLFPPNEWATQDQPPDQREPGRVSNSRHLAKHKTMEWSFAGAMSEVQVDEHDNNDETRPAPIGKEELTTSAITTSTAKSKKHDTMQWSFSSAMKEVSAAEQRTSRRITPPFFATVNAETEPLNANTSTSSPTHPTSPSSSSSPLYFEVIDPFASDPTEPPNSESQTHRALEGQGISSFYDRGQSWKFSSANSMMDGPHESHASDGNVASLARNVLQEEAAAAAATLGKDRAEVTMPSIHAVDPRALNDETDPTILAAEFERLLMEMQGVLGGARAAIGIAASAAANNTAAMQAHGVRGIDKAGRERGRSRQRKKRAKPGLTITAATTSTTEYGTGLGVGIGGIGASTIGKAQRDHSKTSQYHYQHQDHYTDADADAGAEADTEVNGTASIRATGKAVRTTSKPATKDIITDADTDTDDDADTDVYTDAEGLHRTTSITSGTSETSSYETDMINNDDDDDRMNLNLETGPNASVHSMANDMEADGQDGSEADLTSDVDAGFATDADQGFRVGIGVGSGTATATATGMGSASGSDGSAGSSSDRFRYAAVDGDSVEWAEYISTEADPRMVS